MATATKARPVDGSFIFSMGRVPFRSAMAVGMLWRPFQQTALDQPARPTAPGQIGARAQVGLLDIDKRSGPNVANPVSHRIIHSCDPRDDPDHRLVGVKSGGDPTSHPSQSRNWPAFAASRRAPTSTN